VCSCCCLLGVVRSLIFLVTLRLTNPCIVSFLVTFCAFLSKSWAVCFPKVNALGFSVALLSTIGTRSVIFPFLLHFVYLSTCQFSSQNLQCSLASLPGLHEGDGLVQRQLLHLGQVTLLGVLIIQPAYERHPDPLVHLRHLESAGGGHAEVAGSSKSTKASCELSHSPAWQISWQVC
jgi:hypothetical protein